MRVFAGRVAVVTGAAGGLGRELANRAASLGMKLVLADVDAGALARATGELQAGGAEVLSMVCDVSRSAHVEELADAAIARFHCVHLLFNSAGRKAEGPVWDTSAAEWEAVLGANLWGAIHGVRVFTPLMLECARRDPRYEGHIVNAAAASGPPSARAMGICKVSRQAVVALSEALHDDLCQVGAPLKASVLCPEQGSSAAAVAQAFDAIAEGRFWVYPHGPRLPC